MYYSNCEKHQKLVQEHSKHRLASKLYLPTYICQLYAIPFQLQAALIKNAILCITVYAQQVVSYTQ